MRPYFAWRRMPRYFREWALEQAGGVFALESAICGFLNGIPLEKEEFVELCEFEKTSAKEAEEVYNRVVEATVRMYGDDFKKWEEDYYV